MGNYQSTDSERFQPVLNTSHISESFASGGTRDLPEQESTILNPKEIYVVCNNNTDSLCRYYYTESRKKATDYVDQLIYNDIAVNYGYHLRTDEDEYEDEIVYTLYRQDPTSLFCKYSFYGKYRILKVQSLPHIVPTTDKKTD